MVRKLLAVVGLGMLLVMPLTLGQADEQSEQAKRPAAWGLTLGYLTGDAASELEQDGFRAELDDSVTLGVFYLVKMSESTDFETRFTFSSTKMLNTENGDVTTTLMYLDFTLIPHINIGKFKLGVPMGMGWAVSSASDPFLDQVRGRTIGLAQTDGSGVTYYLGLRKDFDLKGNWDMFVDARARRFHRLVNVRERSVKSTEVTFGFVKHF